MRMLRRRLLAASTALGLPRMALAAWNKGDAVILPPLTLLDGGALDVGALKGKVVVLQFWASWCPFCARQNPLVEALYRAQRARGLAVVAVSVDKSRQAAQDYMQKRAYSFAAGMITPDYQAIFGLRRGLPQVYVIGRDGRLMAIELGEMFEDDVRDLANYL